MDAWDSFLNNQLSVSDADKLLSQTAANLEALLVARPQAEQQVMEIISKRLGSGVQSQTWEAVISSLTYVGPDLARLVGWVGSTDQDNRLTQMEKLASPKVVTFLRTILGLYGVELGKAFVRFGRFDQDWVSFYRDVYYDPVAKNYYLKFRIEKFNGEQAVIEGDPSSMAYLIAYMLRAVRTVQSPDAINPDAFNLLDGEIKEFVEFSHPQKEGTS
jgi:hypothetical protein